MKSLLFVLLLGFLEGGTSCALASTLATNKKARPRYCQPEIIWAASTSGSEFEREVGIERMMRFAIGEYQIVGLAVGNSDAFSVAKKAGSFHDGKYCTWYFNQGNAEASALFHWVYLPKPSSNGWLSSEARQLGWDEIRRQYGAALQAELPAMVNCLYDHKYLAMGCNGMRERGPTVFGMLLSFAGCTPDEVSDIVNPVWGRGWPVAIVSEQDRLDVLEVSFLMGELGFFPQEREKLIHTFSTL